MEPINKNRECGSCTVCCSYLKISCLNKPALTPCQHLLDSPGDGYIGQECGNCTIYEDRPAVCKDYSCLWRRGFGGDDDRPDRCGVLIDTLLPIENSIQCKPIRKGAADTNKGNKAIARISKQRNSPALVAKFLETQMVRVVGRGVE